MVKVFSVIHLLIQMLLMVTFEFENVDDKRLDLTVRTAHLKLRCKSFNVFKSDIGSVHVTSCFLVCFLNYETSYKSN